jgi:hypothetical protein
VLPNLPIPTPDNPTGVLPETAFTRDDRADLAYTAYLLVTVLRSVTDGLGDPGTWDTAWGGVDTLTRIHRALDRILTTVRATRTDLTIIEARVRVRAASTGGQR